MNKYFLLLIIIFIACTVPAKKGITPDEEDYLSKVNEFPTEFTIEENDIDNAWGRAQSWIGKYSSMKVQTVTDFIIQTYNPSSDNYGYYIVKTPVNNDFEINVSCSKANIFTPKKYAETNARILSYYIKTGECMPQFIK